MPQASAVSAQGTAAGPDIENVADKDDLIGAGILLQLLQPGADLRRIAHHGAGQHPPDMRLFARSPIGISKREAMSFQQQDKEVITSGIPKYFVETVTIGNNQKVISILKSPLKNQEGKTIGVFGISYCTAEYDLKKSLPTLVEANLPIKKYHPRITGRKSINFGLSNKQTDCLYWLTKGMTIKQIAKNMNLSPRTVESYLETVKIKLSCNSRMELVEQALKIPAIREQLSR